MVPSHHSYGKRRLWFLALIGWLLTAAALAAPVEATIDATITDDGKQVVGTLTGPTEWVVEDVLGSLPIPDHDRDRSRTFPERANRGRVQITTVRPGVWHFETTLPRRFGDVGRTRRGAFANGAWYPQPKGLPTVDWTVHLNGSATTLLVVGDQASKEHVTWSGTAERVSIAYFTKGTVTKIGEEGIVVSRRKPRKALIQELLAVDNDLDEPMVAVIAPMRRRLVRPGVRLAYVSDRATRLTAGLRFVHRQALHQGITVANTTGPNSFMRQVVGVVTSRQEMSAGPNTEELLSTVSFIPYVQRLLASQNTPFFADILDRTQPGDQIFDDLSERLSATRAPKDFIAQIRARYDEERLQALISAWKQTSDLGLAAAQVGLDAQEVLDLRRPVASQDYQMHLNEGTLLIERVTEEGAVEETLEIIVNNTAHFLTLAPGSTIFETKEPIERVLLDPNRLIADRDRSGSSWPPRYAWTVSGWIETINLSRKQVFGAVLSTLRKENDTRNIGTLSLSNGQANRLSASVGYLRKIGPLQDGWNRPFRLRFSLGGSWLNQTFSQIDGLPLTVDSSVGFSYDRRVLTNFPMRGFSVGISTGVGTLPSTGDVWNSSHLYGLALIPLHPRVVIATKTTASIARSTLPHRLLSFGGQKAMRSLPVLPACVEEGPSPCTELANERVVAIVEARFVPIRDWNVPMLLGWGTELQLSMGLEAVVGTIDNQQASATGLTAGVTGVGDVLGAEPMSLGLTFGWPLQWNNLSQVQPTTIPEIYLRWGQAF